MLSLRTGAGSASDTIAILTGTHGVSGRRETYYIPVDGNGFVSLHFESDARGRRRGFEATLRAVDRESNSFLTSETPCPIAGQSGYSCEISHCVQNNRLIRPKQKGLTPGQFTLGRVVSQASEFAVPAMPWAPDGGCKW